jgi:hypothetical protein
MLGYSLATPPPLEGCDTIADYRAEEDCVERYRKQVRAANEDGKKDRERV